MSGNELPHTIPSEDRGPRLKLASPVHEGVSGDRRPLRPTLIDLLASAFTIFILSRFVWEARRNWFNADITNDDSFQQSPAFWDAVFPGIFNGDLVNEAMSAYLPPLHYGLTYLFTKLTSDAVLGGHWVMFVQMTTCAVFFVLAVRRMASTPAALIALCWYLLLPLVWSRMAAGLPRGWMGVILAAYLYFLVSGRHRAVLATLIVGVFLNPTSVLVPLAAYGMFVLWTAYRDRFRGASRRVIAEFSIACLCIFGVALYVSHPSERIGKMISFEEAEQSPAFSRFGGRFALIPFKPPVADLNTAGTLIFRRPGSPMPLLLRDHAFFVALGLFGVMLGLGALRRRVVVPPEVICLGLGTLFMYFAARELAFHFYIPDRHLRFGLNFFWIIGFSVGLWRLGHRTTDYSTTTLRSAWLSGLLVLSIAVAFVSGPRFRMRSDTGLYLKRSTFGSYYDFVQNLEPRESVIAGHPGALNALPLFSKRRIFMSSEAAHPFYDRYYEEVKRRLEIELTAAYARDPKELLSLRAEGIRYFVFDRETVLRHNGKRASYVPPFRRMVFKLAGRAPESYLAYQLTEPAAEARFPSLLFRNERYSVVDIDKIAEIVGGTTPSTSEPSIR
ncbi:MAG: hypothetical protein IT290_12945 [Deltaproteobacteria bacterium]|nr:hypothetical protein [Deltaproteobacteria bacterium]